MATAYRYWRARIGGMVDAAASYGWLCMVQLLDGAGQNLCNTVGGTASASTNPGSAAPVFTANSASHIWQAQDPVGQWVAWDFGLGNAQVVSGVRWGTNYSGSITPSILWVEASNDQAEWTRTFHLLNRTVDYFSMTSYAALQPGTVPLLLSPFATVEPVVGRPAPVIADVLSPFYRSADMMFGGAFRLRGTLKIDDSPADVPVRRRVVLMAEPTMTPVAATWSDMATGAWSFELISGAPRYTVIALDYTHNYRAVVADNLTAEPMP